MDVARQLDYFDKLGDDFDRFMNSYDVQRRLALVFDVLLQSCDLRDRNVLEVGCGTGKFSEQIVARGARLTVLDIGPHLVQNVSQRLNCAGVTGDACALPFDNGLFDFVISSECIEHTPDPRRAIEQMCRVCRPGGLVCITTPNRIWYPVLTISQKLRLRKFAGIENWISPRRAAAIMHRQQMTDIGLAGCHLWPFQLKFTQPLLRLIDTHCAKQLYPLMINFGIIGRKRK